MISKRTALKRIRQAIEKGKHVKLYRRSFDGRYTNIYVIVTPEHFEYDPYLKEYVLTGMTYWSPDINKGQPYTTLLRYTNIFTIQIVEW